jgi:aminotransferase
VGAATPLQQAGVTALDENQAYFKGLSDEYIGRRAAATAMLEKAGFKCFTPRGAYYVMTDISAFGFRNDTEFAKYMVETIGVAAVPGSSFYSRPELGAKQIRFCFCKKYETLEAAGERLLKLQRV